MRDSLKQTIVISGTLVVMILGALVYSFGSTPNSQGVRPYAALLALDEEVVDEECTPELCGAENEEETAPASCTQDTWSCESWGACSADGSQKRTCIVTADCPSVVTPKPGTTQSCTPPKPIVPKCTQDTWVCGEWNACSAEGTQARSCSKTFDCSGVDTPAPTNGRSCTPPVVTPVITPEVTPPVVVEEEVREAAEENVVTKEDTEKAQQEIVAQQEQAIVQEQRLQEVVQNTPAFRELAGNGGAVVVVADKNGNGLQDAVEDKLDEGTKQELQQQRIADEAQLAAKRKELLAQGKKADVVEKEIKRDRQVSNAKRKQKALKAVAKKAYNNAEPTNEELTAIELGVDPRDVSPAGDDYSPVEKVLYRRGKAGGNALTMSVTPGTQLSANGAAVLIGGPKGMRIELVATDAKNKKYVIARGVIGDNGKTVLVTEGDLTPGFYVFQVRRGDLGVDGAAIIDSGFMPKVDGAAIIDSGFTPRVDGAAIIDSGFMPQVDGAAIIDSGFTPRPERGAAAPQGGNRPQFGTSTLGGPNSSLLAQPEPAINPSSNVLVEVTGSETITDPKVKTIQTVSVESLKNIRVKRTADGKIRVTGTADLDTTVIGSFKSAVFTSAILADVQTGAFTVSSAGTLEDGDHEVIIYATRSEDGTQSRAVKVPFSIIEQETGDGKLVVGQDDSSSENSLPVVPIAIAMGLVAIVVVSVLLSRRKRKDGSSN